MVSSTAAVHSKTERTLPSVMKSPVKTFRADLPVAEALELAERYGMHHLPLLVEGKITGLVCTCDLQELELSAPIGDAVGRAPVTVPMHATLERAAEEMAEEHVGSVLVTDASNVVGILTREDLARAGVELDDYPGFRCECCGSVKHLKTQGDKGTLCLDCRLRAEPETPGDGTGVGD